MVKYKSLLEKYCCSLVDGKENTFTENINKPKDMSPEQKSEEDQYVPSWRAPCDAWVTANVVDCTGVNTPVYLLYNAYINDNPDDYMDIGQFGKVLRSRFPYRKRRRGKQGQQVYVYQDVALKNKEESAEKGAKSYQLTSEDPKHPKPLQQIPAAAAAAAAAGPAILVGNSTGGRLLSSPRPVTEEEVSALTSKPLKRNCSESTLRQSPSYKRLKKNDETEFIAVPSGSAAVQQDTDSNQHSKHEPLNITDGDEKYTNTNLCRMAIGRRWIDVNLIDMVGVHTYATDICQAYAQDHPNEPLNFTSMALLIRGKYPGRRRKVTVGSETRYLYQDIKLIRNEVGSSQGDATSSQKSKNLEEELSSFSTEAVYESTTHKTTDKETSSHLNPFVAWQVNRGPTAATNIPKNSYVAYIPVLNYQSGSMGTLNSALVTRPIPSTSYVVTKDSDLSALTITQGNIPNLDDLLAGNNKLKMSHNNQGFGIKAKSNDKRNKEEQKIREDGKKVTNTSQDNQTVKETLSDMNVSDYLESELLEINDICKNMPNYKLSIQVPSGKLIRTNSIPSFSQKSFRGPENVCSNVIKSEMDMGENEFDLVKDYPTGFGGLLHPRSSDENVNDTSNTGESKQCSSRVSEKIPIVDKDPTPVVKEVTDRSSLDLHQSWDYKIRKVVGPEPTSSVQNETFCMSKNKIKRNKINNNRKDKVPKTKINEKIQLNHQNTSDLKKSESLNDYPQKVMEKLIGTARDNDPRVESKECSITNISQGNGGSPTSTSPPCPAMNRLAEEIITSTPHVAGPLQHESAFSSSSTNVQEPRIKVNSANKADPRLLDPRLLDIIRSIILTAKQTVSKPEETLNQAHILKMLERVVIEKNPAVFYEESTESDSFPCSVMPGLKDLVLSSPERINDLLRHHQTCVGLGCSKECQILRAAYVHISIFHHKCQIWNAFSKIVSKHSRPCRVVSCGVEFCHFVKHELHLNGVSVLPMQLLKERPTLEEEFKNCEKIGTHDGDLHCRHMQCPRLPVMNQSVLQLKNYSKQEDVNITMNTNSIFPDTPSGNTLAVPVIKVIRLVRDLFRKSMEVG